jgi:phosphate transport system substrate-binding protein
MKVAQILKLAVFSMLAGLFFMACGRGGQSITAAGSTAFQPFAEKLADQFMMAHSGINITIQGGGSAVGIQSALSGAANIGMADMVNLPAEAKALSSFTVARDGIVMIVNPKNGVSNITTQQIRDIYNGTIKNWKEIGGSDGPITIISREAGSGTRSSFEAIVKDISLAKGALIQDSNGTVRETVANDANSIGYISHGLINDKIRALKVNGIECTIDEINRGSYILVRPVFFLTKGAPTGEIKSFIDYILSPQGQDVIRANGLIPAK